MSDITPFDRKYSLQNLKQKNEWDFIIIGGGATGLGAALDASSRGYSTLLLERKDFASGTSSRSTKLAHGGVRYLAQGNIALVTEALKERGLMIQNAPHLVHMLPFVIPSYHWWEKYYYAIGLKIYDWMARKFRIGKTQLISREKVKGILNNLNDDQLNGGVRYFDGQFDDARLAVNIARTCGEQGAILLNYFEVTNLIQEENQVRGVVARDLETGLAYSLHSKVVINATGVFVDDILKLNRKDSKPLVKVSQGIHIVLDHRFLPGENALMIPKTSDGRVLFAVPWRNHLLVGTTDTPLAGPAIEPIALEEEVEFIFNNLQHYLKEKPTRDDILSVFAGLRPLALPQDKNKGTKEISRDHKLVVAPSQLITITGGKWTTYRKMAEDTIDEAIKVANLPYRTCVTQSLKIHGYSTKETQNGHLSIYGSDAEQIQLIASEHPSYKELLHPKFPHILAEVIWFIQNEMARTVDDILSRRLRILFLDAQAAIHMAPKIAHTLAAELQKDSYWAEKQIDAFNTLAQNYLPKTKRLDVSDKITTIKTI